MKFPTKFPTIIGLLLLVLTVGIVMYVTNIFLTPSNASASQQPNDVEFTNISDSSFTVSWTTQLPTTATALVSSEEKSDRIYYDDRDTTGKLGTFTTHSISVRDAAASTHYTVKLLSNGRQYLNNGTPFDVQTASALSPNTNGLEPAYGTIHSQSDTPADGALIYLVIEGGQKLSTISKPSGTWLIALNQIRTQDLTSFLPTIDRMTETLTVRQDEMETTAITDTLNDSPVPEMTLGKQYDFRKQQAKTSDSKFLTLRGTPSPQITSAHSPQLPAGGAVLGDQTNRIFSVSLTSPAQGASLPSSLPFIQGTGVPGKFIGISLGITSIVSGSTKVSADGSWNFTPSQTLPPGKQSVTISTIDSHNKPVAITHTFTILKSGTQVLGDATPSASLTITPSPITEISPAVETTPTSTLSGQTPPTTGYELPIILMAIIGISIFTSGAIALIK